MHKGGLYGKQRMLLEIGRYTREVSMKSEGAKGDFGSKKVMHSGCLYEKQRMILKDAQLKFEWKTKVQRIQKVCAQWKQICNGWFRK